VDENSANPDLLKAVGISPLAHLNVQSRYTIRYDINVDSKHDV